MTTISKTLLAFFLTLSLNIASRNHDSKPLIARDKTNKKEKKNKLLVFTGEKIEVTELPYERGSMYGGFKAKYKNTFFRNSKNPDEHEIKEIKLKAY